MGNHFSGSFQKRRNRRRLPHFGFENFLPVWRHPDRCRHAHYWIINVGDYPNHYREFWHHNGRSHGDD